MTTVILCGGSGTRLWPLSRTLMPKQFVKLLGDSSLFQSTLKRNHPLSNRVVVVTNEAHYFLIEDEVEVAACAVNLYLLESVARNTAPAIALAALSLPPDEVMLVVPSDHLIQDFSHYKESIDEACRLASDGNLVTFGIKPTYPETGYGYIEACGNEVRCFHEKPTYQKAEVYVNEGNYYWNSGMFCFKAGVFLEELKAHAPDIFEASSAAFKEAKLHENRLRIPQEWMERIPENSIDYAVMEKSRKTKMVRADFGWNDVGSFDSLSQEMESDAEGNLILKSETKREIALLDVKNLIVVDTPDALLIAQKGSSQKVKEVVARLREDSPELTHTHRTTHRPWGSYTVLEEESGYKIKRIMVKPRRRLSLQKHYHRNEHWIVVSGIAQVQVGAESFLLHPNQSTYIQMGEVHRLENIGQIPLVMIEVQVGEYLGEDDIVRIEDDYQREC